MKQHMNVGTTRLRGRPRYRWQDEVREDGRIVGGEGWQEKYMTGMEEAPVNGKETSHSAHANGMNELYVFFCVIPRRLNFICRRFGTLCPIFIRG